ncbi:hypothetical protein KLPMCK396B_23510 [Klebsiella pneumoniae]
MKPFAKGYMQRKKMIHVPVCLCLLMLFGCSKKISYVPNSTDMLIPYSFFAPNEPPLFNVVKWGDYPGYVYRLNIELEKCNSDKMAIYHLIEQKK